MSKFVQSILEGRNASIWRKREPTHIKLLGTDGLNCQNYFLFILWFIYICTKYKAQLGCLIFYVPFNKLWPLWNQNFAYLGWFLKSVSLIQIRFDRFRVYVKKTIFFLKKNVIFLFFRNLPPLVYWKWCAYKVLWSICRGIIGKKYDFFLNFRKNLPPWCTGSGVPIRSYGQNLQPGVVCL